MARVKLSDWKSAPSRLSLRICALSVAALLWTILLFTASTDVLNHEKQNRYLERAHQNHSHIDIRRGGHDSGSSPAMASALPANREVQHGNYTSLENALIAKRTFGYHDSITMTTHATYEELDNLVELSRRWDGPISVALYAPLTDFRHTLLYALWLRHCHQSIADLVTFHFVYPSPGARIWIPDNQFWSEESQKLKFRLGEGVVSDNGEDRLPYNYTRVLHEVLADFRIQTESTSEDNSIKTDSRNASYYGATVQCDNNYPGPPSGRTYRARHHLSMPINVCRNTARLTARTHFVMAVDIELYPSAGVVPMFLNYSRRMNVSDTGTRRVYVLPHFEVKRSVDKVPSHKNELVDLYQRKLAVDFHKFKCARCHMIPKVRQWLNFPVGDILNAFTTIKRETPYDHWEPFYIGTNTDPLYTELLTWEGGWNKMTQMYEVCLLNYELVILDNAFLVHRPGIKRRNTAFWRLKLPYIRENIKVYSQEIRALKKKHGERSLCNKKRIEERNLYLKILLKRALVA